MGEAELLGAPGALRILSRNEGRQVLILHGEDRLVGIEERLAYVAWFSSEQIAEAVSRQCSQLLGIAKMPAGPDGWHDYAEAHVKTLVCVAKDHLCLRPIELGAPRGRWTHERVARLGFLAGLGWTAKRIAGDPLILSTPNNVYRQAHRFGISLAAAPGGRFAFTLPAGTSAAYEAVASRKGLTKEALVRRLIIAAASNVAALEAAAG